MAESFKRAAEPSFTTRVTCTDSTWTGFCFSKEASMAAYLCRACQNNKACRTKTRWQTEKSRRPRPLPMLSLHMKSAAYGATSLNHPPDERRWHTSQQLLAPTRTRLKEDFHMRMRKSIHEVAEFHHKPMMWKK